MRVAEINMVNFGSTGTIALRLADAVRESGGVAHTYYTRVATKRYAKLPAPPDGETRYGTFAGNNLHSILARVNGNYGFYSRCSTRKLLRQLQAFRPDIVHLHNLHAAYLNLPMLFAWLRKSGVHVVWTFHDCWPFTANCPHFDYCGCEKWKTGCHHCEQLSRYPSSLLDRTEKLWKKKRDLFTSLPDLTIGAPSNWIASMAEQSFFSGREIHVIPTGINLSVFRPTDGDFRKTHNCVGKYIVLGVANPWSDKKGIDVFARLASRLDSRFQIVLVGKTDALAQPLPGGIICLPPTTDRRELAALYTAADVFANPTREETLGLVNIEALACGTPVITFRSGGSPEVIDSRCGVSVPRDDEESFEREIVRICTTSPYKPEDCVARAALFGETSYFEKYLSLYNKLMNGRSNA